MKEISNSEATPQHDLVHRDDAGARMGMWLFLFTELLLFGGMFLIYAVYRFTYPEQFKVSGMELDTLIGTINTLILLTSSLTVVLSIVAMQKGKQVLSIIYLAVTNLLGVGFMINKYFEWSAKFSHGIYPGSEELLNKDNGEIIFFGLYYVMTGLHGLHVIIGIIIFCFMITFIIRNNIKPDNYVKLENAGLYWHLVDLIWIFLFPLFYLIQ